MNKPIYRWIWVWSTTLSMPIMIKEIIDYNWKG